MRKNIFKNMDWGVFVCSVALCIIGLIALFSATHESGFESFQRQVIWLAVSIVVVFIIIMIDYEMIAKAAPYFYRCIYGFINSCSFYRTYKWCNKLV